MEQYKPSPEQPIEAYDALFEEEMKKVDILVANKYDFRKIGEIIRLIDYLQELSRGNDATPPEPDPELFSNYKETIDPKQRMQIDISPDESFARTIYGVIPEALKKAGIKGALTMLDNFLDTAVINSQPTKMD